MWALVLRPSLVLVLLVVVLVLVLLIMRVSDGALLLLLAWLGQELRGGQDLPLPLFLGGRQLRDIVVIHARGSQGKLISNPTQLLHACRHWVVHSPSLLQLLLLLFLLLLLICFARPDGC